MDQSKQCTGRCGLVKPLSEFGAKAASPDGHAARCRRCRGEDARERYLADPAPRRAVMRRYKEENRDTLVAEGRRYYAANQDSINQRRRLSYAADPGTRKAGSRSYTADLRSQVITHYGSLCACCSATANLEIDHVDGGGTRHRRLVCGPRYSPNVFYLWVISNGYPSDLQLLCRPCNRSKGEGARCRIDHSNAAKGSVNAN